MASGEEDGDEMGSLFEGMVLFNPSQTVNEDHHHPLPTSIPLDASTSSSLSPFAQPLDENLFSDLTLVTSDKILATLPPQIDETDDPSSLTKTAAPTTEGAAIAATTMTIGDVPPLSRQASRKKKRPGLRIGYGRDPASVAVTPLPDDVDSRPVKLDHSPPSSSEEKNDASLLSSESRLADPHPPSPFSAAPPFQILRDTKDSSQDDSNHDESHLIPDAASLTSNGETLNSTGASTEVKFDQIRARISCKLNHARDLVASISAKRKDSMTRKRTASQNLNLATLKYRELEKQLEEASEAEDFETAERLSESLAAAEKDKQALLIALRDAEADSDAIDSNMLEVLEAQIAAEEECASLLEHFTLLASNDADLISSKAETVSSKEMDEWLSSTEALEMKKMEVEIESQLINEARLTLNYSIENSVEDDMREKERLCRKKNVLTDELNKLLALVKAKEEEIAENDSNIEAVEKKISDVVSGFQETRFSIDARYDSLQSGLSQLELESEALLIKKKEIDDLLSREEDRGAKLREVARVSADEAKAYQEVIGLRRGLVLSILKSCKDKVRLGKIEEKLSEDVQMLRLKVSAERASLQALSSTKSSIQQEIATAKQRIFFIDKRVPELEAEKKVAAAARNFKEAARISAEAKTLSVEKEDVLSRMERALVEVGKLEEVIKDTIIRLEETEGLILVKEKEVALARFQRLHLIAGFTMAERSAALELGDLDEASLLLAEAEAAESEAKKIQPIYNFEEEEFANLPKPFISMELVSSLGRKQLAELASSVHPSAF